MVPLTRGNQFQRVALTAPAVFLAYAVLAYAVVATGCAPAFVDVEFFGVKVSLFLLLALTSAALILIIFACLSSLRVLRVLRRRHRGEQYRSERGLGAAAVVIAFTAFAGTAWLGWVFFRTPC